MFQKIKIILLILIILIGVIYRIRYTETFMTDYDDVGTVTLIGAINMPIELIKHPFQYYDYIGKVWTYAPGQFLLFPLLWLNENNLISMHIHARYFVNLFSILNIFLLIYIFYKDDKQKLKTSSILSISLLSLSFLNIAYSYHTSPFTVGLTTMLILFIFLQKKLQKNISTIILFAIMGLLTHFNYIILITVPIVVLIICLEEIKYDLKCKKIYQFIKGNCIDFLLSGILYGLIIAPLILLYFKSTRGLYGEWLYESLTKTELSLSNKIYQFIINFITKNYDIFHNTINFSYKLPQTIEYLIYIPLAFITLIGIFGAIKNTKSRNIGIFLLLFYFTWLALHTLKKLPFDSTRHMIYFVPFYLYFIKYGIDYLSSYFTKINFRYFAAGLIIICITLFLFTKNLFFTERINKFDYNYVKNYIIENNIKMIIVEIHTLQALALAFELKDIDVLYHGTLFAGNYNLSDEMINNPHFQNEEVLYVSQNAPISDITNANFVEHHKTLQNKIEIDSQGIYFSPNNNPVSSVPNGFYFYSYK